MEAKSLFRSSWENYCCTKVLDNYNLCIHYVTMRYRVYVVVAYCLQYCYCCINPIALFFLSKSFKNHYINQLCCCRKSAQPDSTELATVPHSNAPNPQNAVKSNQLKTHRYNYTDETDATTYELSKFEHWVLMMVVLRWLSITLLRWAIAKLAPKPNAYCNQ